MQPVSAGATTVPASPTSLRRLMLLVAALATVAAALGIGVRALQTAHVAVDEEQYVLSAISLAEDGNLDLTDELTEQRWRAFADVRPHVETVVLANGTQISPHDPLLPLLLAAPTGIGGWIGAKLALSLVAGAVAALTLWLAVRRFGVRRRTAVIGAGIAGASMPLAVYGQQIYPELPAALVTLLGVVALTGGLSGAAVVDTSSPAPAFGRSGAACPARATGRPDTADPPRAPGLRRREFVLLGAAVTALPWLSIKFGLVAAALAGIGVVRAWRAGQRREVVALGAALAGSGGVYLAVHRLVWGGWTAYASGEHFTQTGEFAVVGVEPDYLERALRLVGLLLDREFGLVPWQPAWLLLVPAVAALLTRGAGLTAGSTRLAALVARSARPAAPHSVLSARRARLAARRSTLTTRSGDAPTGPASHTPGPGVLLWPLGAGWFVATFVALTMHGYWFPGRQLVVVLPLAVLVILIWLDTTGPAVRRVALGLGLAGVAGYIVVLVQGWLGQTTWVVHFIDADVPVYRLLLPVLSDWRGEYRWPHLAGLAVVSTLAAFAARHQVRANAAAEGTTAGDDRRH